MDISECVKGIDLSFCLSKQHATVDNCKHSSSLLSQNISYKRDITLTLVKDFFVLFITELVSYVTAPMSSNTLDIIPVVEAFWPHLKKIKDLSKSINRII